MHVCVKMMSKGSKEALTVLIMAIIFYFFQLLRHRIFHRTLQDTMQHVVSTPLTYPGSCKTCFSHIPVFWWEDFLNISNHLPDSSFA